MVVFSEHSSAHDCGIEMLKTLVHISRYQVDDGPHSFSAYLAQWEGIVKSG